MLGNNKSFKKTRTFDHQLNRALSMELQNSPPPPSNVSSPQRSATFNGGTINRRSSSLLEFPTSPQLPSGEQILHFSHLQHPLSKIDVPDLFTCAGCKEYGAGKRFTCQDCRFQLHEFCAFAPKTLKTHPLHFQHQLLLFSKPVKGGIQKSRCDVCNKPTKGSTFRCSACSFQMHPCCAMLNTEMNNPIHPHTLKLLPSTPLTNGDPGFICSECKRTRSGRVYRCTVCEYHLHAVCVKNRVNGLQENNIKGTEKPSMLKTATWFLKKVVGGLIEGVGQEIGEAFAETVTRGGGSGNKRN